MSTPEQVERVAAVICHADGHGIPWSRISTAPGEVLRAERYRRQAAAVLAELAEDLGDPDVPPADDNQVTVTMGGQARGWCPLCVTSTVLAMAMYTEHADTMVQVGEVRLCTGCGWSPHA